MSKEPFKPIDDLPPLPTTEYLTPTEMLPHIEPGDSLPFTDALAAKRAALRIAEKSLADALYFMDLLTGSDEEFPVRYDALHLRSKLSEALAKVREELR